MSFGHFIIDTKKKYRHLMKYGNNEKNGVFQWLKMYELCCSHYSSQ